LRVVGGGARNALWNRLRADMTGLPVTVTSQQEATVAGAAMAGFVGAGIYSDLGGAQAAFASGSRVFEPAGAQEAYDALYERYRLLPPALQPFYASGG